MIQDLSNKHSETIAEIVRSQEKVVDKALALLSTKDPLAFQTVQAMNNPDLEEYTPYVDNSDQGFYEKYVSEEEEDSLQDYERRLLNGIPNI